MAPPVTPLIWPSASTSLSGPKAIEITGTGRLASCSDARVLSNASRLMLP